MKPKVRAAFDNLRDAAKQFLRDFDELNRLEAERDQSRANKNRAETCALFDPIRDATDQTRDSLIELDRQLTDNFPGLPRNLSKADDDAPLAQLD